MKITMSIIGYGRVGKFLYQNLSPHYEVIQIYNRSKIDQEEIADTKFVDEIAQIDRSDIYFLTVSDDSIPFVAKELFQNDNTHKSLIIHTSGATDLAALLPYKRKAYCWPLQTISESKLIDVKNTPFYVGANYGEDATLLDDLMNTISNKVRIVSENQKKAMHLAATISNNFANLMFSIADDLCNDKDLVFEDLYPIILETTAKLATLSPQEAQTGPAMRGDMITLENHLALIKSWRPELESWYKQNSKLINPDLEL